VVTAVANPSVFEDELPRFGVLAHEVTHVLERWCIPDAPAWLAEGLARFLGTIEVLDGMLVRDRALIRSQCPRPTGNLH